MGPCFRELKARGGGGGGGVMDRVTEHLGKCKDRHLIP